MTVTRDQVVQDLHLRNAARELVKADYETLRADLQAKGVGERAKNRLADSASDIHDEAVAFAQDHKGALAAIVGVLALWFAREPIIDALRGDGRD